MSIRENFTDQEWFLLGSTPGLIGAAVAAAGKSGPFGTINEAMSSMQSLMEGAKDYQDNELIQTLLAKAKSREEAKAEFEKFRGMAMEKLQGKKPAELSQIMLEDTKNVVALLKQKASPSQAEQYKSWAMAVAENVANASREGSFLGFGGEQVSAEEKALLEQIKAALASA
jgi:flagellar motor component MotA